MKIIAFCLITAAMLTACSPVRTFLVSSQGIATYDRQTGKFEILWEHAEKSAPIVHDTVFVDSCKLNKPM